jgi:hypothetical protein
MNNSKNAFALLMADRGSAKKRRKQSLSNRDQASRFVKCPSCQKSFSHVNINLHLENCVKSSSDEQITPQSLSPTQVSKRFHDKIAIGQNNNLNQDPPQDLQRKYSSSPSCSNALQQLMNNSKEYFSRKVKRQQWFHLSNEGEILWICDNPDCFEMADQLDIKWTTTVFIHASRKEESKSRDIELHVTSSIEPAKSYRKMISRKSRLSVPALKSILQKGIRRRRPLPSVRVAMELADKSFGDLIRRLPIICLEDSFLHHEFPFVIWLMVAHSKDYIPNQALIIRLFRVIFEIASCPWQDKCVEPEESPLEQNESDFSLTTSSDFFHSDPACDLMLRTMLMRKKYGGMECDLKMIDTFVRLWSHRYMKKTVDRKLIAECLPKNECHEILWQSLPQVLHPVDKSLNLIAPLIQRGLRCLQKHDICPAGVDFHCSNILDVVSRNLSLRDHANKLYGRNHSSEELAGKLKRACWNCSGGINYRRFWMINSPSADCSKVVDSKTKRLWEIATPLANQFVNSYIKERLVDN